MGRFRRLENMAERVGFESAVNRKLNNLGFTPLWEDRKPSTLGGL
jgi:hypothetical protein